MRGSDLILMAPAIAFAGGLTGLIQYAAHPGDIVYLSTSVVLFVIGASTFAGLFVLLRDIRDDEDY